MEYLEGSELLNWNLRALTSLAARNIEKKAVGGIGEEVEEIRLGGRFCDVVKISFSPFTPYTVYSAGQNDITMIIILCQKGKVTTDKNLRPLFYFSDPVTHPRSCIKQRKAGHAIVQVRVSDRLTFQDRYLRPQHTVA